MAIVRVMIAIAAPKRQRRSERTAYRISPSIRALR
jgi:hypothetical protein